MSIYKSLTELIGKTPMVELPNYSNMYSLSNNLIAKLEYYNPAGSVKDRVAYSMITDAEKKGRIDKETVIIEPTSGNTGIGLAFVCASKGYKLILAMPETMSLERRMLLKALGAQIVLTPGTEGMNGAILKAKDLCKEYKKSFMPNQFENEANPQMHRQTTALEIWDDTKGTIDFFVAGVGTGGTLTGVGEVLKQKNPDIKVIAVEPFDSPVLSTGKAGKHGIQGIGAGFVPKILNTKIIDEIILVKTEEAYDASRKVAKNEGLLVGISSGAAIHAATIVAKRIENKNKKVVVLLPDTGERYLTTDLYNA